MKTFRNLLTTIIITTLLLMSTGKSYAQVAINNDNSMPDNTAMLDVKSTNKGMLIPRLNLNQMDSIQNPATGLTVYVTDIDEFMFYNGTEWDLINSLKPDHDWTYTTGQVYNSFDRIGIGGVPDADVKTTINNTTEYTGLKITTNNSTISSFSRYGILTTLQGEGSGYQVASQNSILSNGNGMHIGEKNYISNSGSGKHYGVYNDLWGTGVGEHFGTYNSLVNSGNGNQYGTYNYITNSGSGEHNGTTCVLSGTGVGLQRGVSTYISNSGDGTHIGIENHLSGTGTGDKYGSLNSISSSAGGTHYGVFSVAEGSGHYSGYFRGRMYVSDSMGIGTDSPQALLHLAGSFRLSDGSQGDGKILSSDADGNTSWVDGSTLNGGGWIVAGDTLYSALDSTLTIKSAKVGIGTVSPQAKLHVANETLDNTSGKHTLYLTENNNQESSGSFNSAKPYYGIGFRRLWNGGAATDIAGIYAYGSAGYKGGLIFKTNNGGGSGSVPNINALVIQPNGNIGIGTNSPSQKLQIKGGTDASLSNYSGYLIIGDELGTNTVFDNNEILARNNGNSSTLFIQGSGSTANTVLNSDGGKVGIGTTTPGELLDVGGAMHLKPGSAPTTANEGDIYMDSSTHKLRCYDGTSWHDLW